MIRNVSGSANQHIRMIYEDLFLKQVKIVPTLDLGMATYQACAQFRISELASIQFLNWNLN